MKIISKKGNICLVTEPDMAGYSTYLIVDEDKEKLCYRNHLKEAVYWHIEFEKEFNLPRVLS